LLPVVTGISRFVDQSGHWAFIPNRAAIRRIPAAQQGNFLNGSFLIQRIRAPDPTDLQADEKQTFERKVNRCDGILSIASQIDK